MELTKNQYEVLGHTVRTGRFSAGGNTLDHKDCQALSEAGLLVNHGQQALSGGDDYFTPTRQGRQKVRG